MSNKPFYAVGDNVKIMRSLERFWCQVMAFCPCCPTMHVKVNNDLINTGLHGLRDGDVLEIQPEEIIEHLPAASSNAVH